MNEVEFFYFFFSASKPEEADVKGLIDLFEHGWTVFDKTVTKTQVIYVLKRVV